MPTKTIRTSRSVNGIKTHVSTQTTQKRLYKSAIKKLKISEFSDFYKASNKPKKKFQGGRVFDQLAEFKINNKPIYGLLNSEHFAQHKKALSKNFKSRSDLEKTLRKTQTKTELFEKLKDLNEPTAHRVSFFVERYFYKPENRWRTDFILTLKQNIFELINPVHLYQRGKEKRDFKKRLSVAEVIENIKSIYHINDVITRALVDLIDATDADNAYSHFEEFDFSFSGSGKHTEEYTVMNKYQFLDEKIPTDLARLKASNFVKQSYYNRVQGFRNLIHEYDAIKPEYYEKFISQEKIVDWYTNSFVPFYTKNFKFFNTQQNSAQQSKTTVQKGVNRVKK